MTTPEFPANSVESGTRGTAGTAGTKAICYPLAVFVLFGLAVRNQNTLFNPKSFDQIEQMSLVQAENSRGSGAIAVGMGQRFDDTRAFGGFQGMTIGQIIGWASSAVGGDLRR